MLAVIFIFMISGFVLLSLAIGQDPLKLSAEVKKEIQEEEMWYSQNLVKKPMGITMPFYYLNKFILSRFNRRGLTNKLFSADVSILPEDFLGLKELTILFFLFCVLVLTKKLEPAWIAVSIIFGYLLPDLYIRIRIQRRKKQISKALPDAIDLLTLCVQGGLDFMRGMTWVVRRSKPNPLVREFAIVLHEVKMGKSRQEALKTMGKRVEMPEVYSFVNTLVHADRMGAPIGEVLSILSEEARRRRFQRGERLALQAPIKMLFPLIFFILPAVAIIVGAPILLQFFQGTGATAISNF